MQNDITSGNPPLSVAQTADNLSPWWRRSALITMVFGFAVLILLTTKVYTDAPPIPERVVTTSGVVVYTGQDVTAGQLVFLKYALMDNGSIWGHGALLGPDFSADYLHTLAVHNASSMAWQQNIGTIETLPAANRAAIEAEVRTALKENRYDTQTKALTVGPDYAAWFDGRQAAWVDYFSDPKKNGGLRAKTITDPTELRQLSAFVAWAAWAAAAQRPGTNHSYTNNFPYDPLAGNGPSADAVLWSAISLIFLLGGTAAVLLAFGKFDYLGWKARAGYLHPAAQGATATPAQRATLKYFAVVALLLLTQTLVGGALAHYRADPGTFYGFDLAAWLPSNLLRTWHLQLALFWIATA